MQNITRRPSSEKEQKNFHIYSILQTKREVSRADLTAITGINPVSISNYTNAFIKHGLVVEKMVGESSGGRPPILLELNNDKFLGVGIFVFEKGIACAVSNLSAKVLEYFTDEGDVAPLKEMVSGALAKIKEKYAHSEVKSVVVSFDDRRLGSAAMERLFDGALPVDTFRVPPEMAAAYIEILANERVFEKKYIFSYKDTGESVFIDGHNFYSSDDDIEGAVYLRAWDAEMGIVSNARRLVGRDAASKAVGLSGEDAGEGKAGGAGIYAAARAGNEAAKETIEFVSQNLGVRLAYLLNIFRPHKIIIGGGVQEAGELFLAPLKESVKRLALGKFFDETEIKYTSFENMKAVASGAAALGVRELFVRG